MAIARDTFTAITNSSTGATSFSYSHTCTGSNLALIVNITDEAGGTLTGVTYNGVSMTPLVSQIGFGTQSAAIYLYGMLNPPTGTHTVAMTRSGTAGQILSGSASYTGVKQTGLPDATAKNTASGTNITTTITTMVAGAGIVGCGLCDNGLTTGTNSNLLSSIGGVYGMTENSTFPVGVAGAYAMSLTGGNGTSNDAYILVSLAPFVATVTNSGFFLAFM